MNLFKAYFPPVADTSGKVSVRLTIHHAVYFLLLVVLAGSQSVSKFMMSGMEILLAVNWLLEWDMRYKFTRNGKLRENPLLTAFLVLMGVHLLWLVPTQDLQFGLDDIFKKLPLLAIPLVVLTSRPLNKQQTTFVFLFFTTTVFVATIIGRVRMATIPDLPYRDIIPYISHIRFSLNVCLAIVLSVWFIIQRYKRLVGKTGKPGIKASLGDWLTWLITIIIISFLDFLFQLRSYTGLAILFVTSAIIFIAFWKRITSKGLKISAATLMCAAIVAGIATSATMIHRYYNMVPMATAELAAKTANGNEYTHKNDGLIENGNYINNYICRQELEREWAKRSATSLDDLTPNEYSVYLTLIRYLNALGTTKDSAGIQLLNAADVEAIEKGIANPVYINGNTLEKMYYVMLFEHECYRKTGAVKNFTMLQRFELWKNAWRTFRKHPLFGIGTGDVVQECHKQLIIDESPLAGTTKHAHNQYLTFLVAFGVTGFVIIVYYFIRALRREKLTQMPAAAALLCITLISFVTEDTLETLAGCVFAVLFLCLLSVMWRTEHDINKPS